MIIFSWTNAQNILFQLPNLKNYIVWGSKRLLHTTILDKTVEKIVYLDSIFLNIVAVPVLPSPPSPESNVVVHSKESLIPGRLWEATLILGEGVFFPQRRRFGNSFVA